MTTGPGESRPLSSADARRGQPFDPLHALRGVRKDAAVLWRGTGGSDLDVLVLEGHEAEFDEHLRSAGLLAVPRGGGRRVWLGAAAPVDVTSARGWPTYYPGLEGFLSRCARQVPPLPIASPEDRLLMLAAEAVQGRPLEAVAAKCRALLLEPGTRGRLESLAAQEGAEPLARLVSDPARMEQMARRGRLPWRAAAALAVRSGAARGALCGRAAGRLRALRWREAPLIALSGMDGAGKSSLAETVQAHLADRGLHAERSWTRIAAGHWPMVRRVAEVLKQVLQRDSVADPVAANAPHAPDGPVSGRGRHDVLGWLWVFIVSGLVVRDHFRAAHAAATGTATICDRWSLDALVDLRLRYGRHRGAELLLRRLAPRADLVALLMIDPETSMRRKPGDQDPQVLAAMADLYAQLACDDQLLVIDARRPLDQVAEDLLRAVDLVVGVP